MRKTMMLVGSMMVSFPGLATAGPDYCTIGGVQFQPGDTNPDNPCEVCRPGQDYRDWSGIGVEQICDDGDACTVDDACMGRVCAGLASGDPACASDAGGLDAGGSDAGFRDVGSGDSGGADTGVDLGSGPSPDADMGRAGSADTGLGLDLGRDSGESEGADEPPDHDASSDKANESNHDNQASSPDGGGADTGLAGSGGDSTCAQAGRSAPSLVALALAGLMGFRRRRRGQSEG